MSKVEVLLRHRAGPIDIDVSFALDAPWTVLFAPSGAGKTTILRLMAGLDRPHTGRVAWSSGAVLVDTAARIFVPPHRRGVRLVAQRPALFPHLSVLQNVRYRAPHLPGFLADLAALCRIGHLLDKMPGALSGGERQRVALARTLAAGGGSLLLLDEPFTGLESDLRDAIIRDLRAWTRQQSMPVLLVTHDLGEVFAADAHVLRMEAGRIVASGPAAEVLAAERDRLIAQLGSRLDLSADSFLANSR